MNSKQDRRLQPAQVRNLTFMGLLHSLTPGAAWAIAGALAGVFGAGYAVRALVDPLLHQQSVAAQHAQLRETPMGVSDGANRTFLLQRTPPDPAQVKVFLGGLLLDRDAYVISGRTLTFAADAIPVKGENVEVEY